VQSSATGMQQHGVVQGSCVSLAGCLSSQLRPAGLMWLDGIWTVTGLVSLCHLPPAMCFYSKVMQVLLDHFILVLSMPPVQTIPLSPLAVTSILLQCEKPACSIICLICTFLSSHLLGTMTMRDLPASPSSTFLQWSLPIWLLLSLSHSTPWQG